MNSAFGWIGGKRLLRKEILSRFPEETPGRYVEVFAGAAWVLFGKDRVSGQLEVLGDIDGDLINLYRCMKHHAGEMQRELSLLLSARELFFDFRSQLQSRGLTDIQRAARYFYVIKASFGSDRHSFKTRTTRLTAAVQLLTTVQARLEDVVIEHKDFADLIRVYDSPGALFYLDPPYCDSERYYEGSFGLEEHRLLRQLLGELQGKFILSYGDHPLVRELYGEGFRLEEVSRQHNLANRAGASSRYAELIIRNY